MAKEHLNRGAAATNAHKHHLFGFQSQFDKDLLQLLVDKVDTKLLKAVFLQEQSNKVSLGFLSQYPPWNRPDLEDLKAVNIQNSDTELLVWLLDGFIYGLEKTKKRKETCASSLIRSA